MAAGSSEGIIQAQMGDDGIPSIVIAAGAKKPGGKAPDLSGLRGMDLLSVAQGPGKSGASVRERLYSRHVFHYPLGNLYMGVQPRWLEDMQLAIGLYNNWETGVGIPHYSLSPTANDIVCYASSQYFVYEWYIDFRKTNSQIVTFSHGPFTAKAEIFFENKIVYAKINDGPAQFVINTYNSEPWAVNLGFILPLEGGLTPVGLGNQELDDVLGVWKVDANPPFNGMKAGSDTDPMYPGEPGAGSTPFEFTLKALRIDSIEAEYRPDIVDPDTGTKFSGGALFKAKARFTSPGTRTRAEDQHDRMVYRAEVFIDGEGTVRTIYGTTEVPGTDGTPISIDWDGKDNQGRPLPGDTVYGVSITGMLDDDGTQTDLTQIKGYIYNITPESGPPGVAPRPPREDTLEVNPTDYVPYTDAEIKNYAVDENGDYYWLDNDGDGVPNFPDHDGNEEEDFAPGDYPPPLVLQGNFEKLGYDTDWVLRIYKENGEEITTGYSDAYDGLPPFTGKADINKEWLPPGDLGNQPITFKVTLNRCRRQPDMQVNWRSTGGICATEEVAQVHGGPPKLEVLARSSSGLGSNPDVIASSDDIPNSLTTDALKRLSAVNRLDVWTLRASGLSVDQGQTPDSITVELEGVVSKLQPRSVTLAKTAEGIYEGVLSPTTGIIKTDEELQVQTSFGLADTFDRTTGPGSTFLDTLTVLVNALALNPSPSSEFVTYARDRRRMGKLTRLERPPTGNLSIADDEALASPENVKKFGFEAVKVTLKSSQHPKLTDDLVATVKVGRSNSLFCSVNHGGFDAGLEFFEYGADFLKTPSNLRPESLDPQFLDNLKTWIFASCHVLDLHDYNNNRVKSDPIRQGPNDPISLRSSPGQLWWQATGQGKTILLGYNYPVFVGSAQESLKKYLEELDRLNGRVPPERLQQYAWLSANLKRGGRSLNACAWDKENYYFISYYPPIDEQERLAANGDKPDLRIRGIFAIPLDATGDNQSIIPNEAINGAPVGAVPVEILEVN